MGRSPDTTAAGLHELFDSNASSVFGFLMLRCGSRSIAEDLTAETFAAASERFANGAGNEVTPAWLRTVARRRLIDHWRRSSSHRDKLRRLASEREPAEPPAHDPDGPVDRALDSLPHRQRAALLLRYVDDFSVSEVAEALDTSYKATESLLSRARSAFAVAYEQEQDID